MKKLSELYRDFDQWGERRWPWFSKWYVEICIVTLLLVFMLALIL